VLKSLVMLKSFGVLKSLVMLRSFGDEVPDSLVSPGESGSSLRSE
jgi:hypothetical protein